MLFDLAAFPKKVNSRVYPHGVIDSHRDGIPNQMAPLKYGWLSDHYATTLMPLYWKMRSKPVVTSVVAFHPNTVCALELSACIRVAVAMGVVLKETPSDSAMRPAMRARLDSTPVPTLM